MNPLLMQQNTQLQLQIIKYEEPIILVLGNLGNLANILIFGRRELRKNVCSCYFICLCIAQILTLNSLCLSRIIVTHTGNNVFQYISSLCKLRAYIFELSLLLARYFLCLISIDRWMVTSSNAWLRHKSSTRISRWLIIGGIIFWTIFSLHTAIGFQPGPVDCAPPFGSTYQLFDSIESIVTSMAPMFIMSIFSILTVLNVSSRINHQIHPTKTNNSRSIKTQQTTIANTQVVHQLSKRNIQLVRLSFLQVSLYLLLNSIWSIIPIYSFLVGAQALMDSNQQMMLLFLGRFGLNLLFTYAASTFILYTSASKAFRQECITTIKQWLIIVHRRF